MWDATYKVDDASGGLLVAAEEEALAGLGSPGDIGVVGGGVLLVLEVVGEGLGLVRVSAEEEELLAGDEVPSSQAWLVLMEPWYPLFVARFWRHYLLGEAGALSLVAKLALLDGLDLLLLLSLLLLGRLFLCGSLVGLDSLLDRLVGSGHLGGGRGGLGGDGSNSLLGLDLLRHHDVLLFLGHCEKLRGYLKKLGGIWVSQEAVKQMY